MANDKFKQHGEEAKRLFVEEGDSAKIIAAKRDISVKTVRSWIKAGKWKDAKKEHLKTKEQARESAWAIYTALLDKYALFTKNKKLFMENGFNLSKDDKELFKTLHGTFGKEMPGKNVEEKGGRKNPKDDPEEFQKRINMVTKKFLGKEDS